MFILIYSLVIAVLIVAAAILANKARSRQEWTFELKPNCLLTRYPLLFVTGPRSLFYFSNYWNQYPVVLAEHGYEVFTLHLPWSKPTLRIQKMQDFFQVQSELGRKFHLVVDSPTYSEVGLLLLTSPLPTALVSLTEVSDGTPRTDNPSRLPLPSRTLDFPAKTADATFLKLINEAHRLLARPYRTPSLECLGAVPETGLQNAWSLLTRAQELAETDLIEG